MTAHRDAKTNALAQTNAWTHTCTHTKLPNVATKSSSLQAGSTKMMWEKNFNDHRQQGPTKMFDKEYITPSIENLDAIIHNRKDLSFTIKFPILHLLQSLLRI